ncbi:MAG TPA: hypothetical protein C5S50_04170 [Methanosarcinaceae archaeon]|nr:hypothetical protein [Methanosarcinaceae archaeon]
MAYNINIISTPEADKHWQDLKKENRLLLERKVDINGCCIKLITDQPATMGTFDENFYHFGERIRSHGRILVFDNIGVDGFKVDYDPFSRTAFIWNCDYYGYVKSQALAVAGDVLEDVHRFYSLHGACLEYNGSGVAIVAPSGTGKTTLGYGLMRRSHTSLVSDDWFFTRFQHGEAVCMSSEKNVYIREGIEDDFEEFKPIMQQTHLDSKHRAVINLRNVIGAAKMHDKTTLETFFTLKRDHSDQQLVRSIGGNEMIDYLLANDFCNPHLLIKDERKLDLRIKFFEKLFKKVNPYIVNTISTPQKTIDAMLDVMD